MHDYRFLSTTFLSSLSGRSTYVIMTTSSDMHVITYTTMTHFLGFSWVAELKTSCRVTTEGDNDGNCSSYSLHSSKPWKPFFFLPSFLLMDEATPSLKRCSCFTGSACVIRNIVDVNNIANCCSWTIYLAGRTKYYQTKGVILKLTFHLWAKCSSN